MLWDSRLWACLLDVVLYAGTHAASAIRSAPRYSSRASNTFVIASRFTLPSCDGITVMSLESSKAGS